MQNFAWLQRTHGAQLQEAWLCNVVGFGVEPFAARKAAAVAAASDAGWGETPQVTAAAPSFEEVALRLVEASDPAALQTFLLTKLHTLGPADKAQVPPLIPPPPGTPRRVSSHATPRMHTQDATSVFRCTAAHARPRCTDRGSPEAHVAATPLWRKLVGT